MYWISSISKKVKKIWTNQENLENQEHLENLEYLEIHRVRTGAEMYSTGFLDIRQNWHWGFASQVLGHGHVPAHGQVHVHGCR